MCFLVDAARSVPTIVGLYFYFLSATQDSDLLNIYCKLPLVNQDYSGKDLVKTSSISVDSEWPSQLKNYFKVNTP